MYSPINKQQRDTYIQELTDYWQLSFQRMAFLQLTVKLDAIVSSVRFEPVDEMLLDDVNRRAHEALAEWANLNKSCPELSNTSRFWVKLGHFPNIETGLLRIELSDDLRYLSTGTCRVNLVCNIARWPDHALSTAYRREILKEDV